MTSPSFISLPLITLLATTSLIAGCASPPTTKSSDSESSNVVVFDERPKQPAPGAPIVDEQIIRPGNKSPLPDRPQDDHALIDQSNATLFEQPAPTQPGTNTTPPPPQTP